MYKQIPLKTGWIDILANNQWDWPRDQSSKKLCVLGIDFISYAGDTHVSHGICVTVLGFYLLLEVTTNNDRGQVDFAA